MMQVDIQQTVDKIKRCLQGLNGLPTLEIKIEYDFPEITVSRDQVYHVLQALKENKETGFTFLTTLCGIHFPEKKDNEFWVMYQLHNLFTNERIRVYSSASADDPVFASVTPLWAAANWMERETFDFYGLQFEGHPNLTRILNVDEMDYHPMRKEYKLEDDSRTDKDDTYFGR